MSRCEGPASIRWDDGSVLDLVAQLVRLTAEGHLRWQHSCIVDYHDPQHRIPGTRSQHTYSSSCQGVGFTLDCSDRQAVILSVGNTGLQVVSSRLASDYVPLAVRIPQTESALEDPLDVLRHVVMSDSNKLEGTHRIISAYELSNELSAIGFEDSADSL